MRYSILTLITLVAMGPSTAHAEPIPVVDESCLSHFLCSLKEKVRWRSRPWSQEECNRIAGAFLEASVANQVRVELGLAIMLNESNGDSEVVVDYLRPDGTVQAKDSGLMQMHCVINKKGYCINGVLKGVHWKTLLDPVKNIKLGMAELAFWRNGEAGSTTCKHVDHAWWAHYNHGTKYIRKGSARHYPHRIAVLYAATVEALHTPYPEELTRMVTMKDPKQKQRHAKRPVERRSRHIVTKIASCSHVCRAVTLDTNATGENDLPIESRYAQGTTLTRTCGGMP